MIKRLLNASLACLLLIATLVTAVPTQAFATTGNNGTLKVHELGTDPGTESNDPKVCAFNFEGFGFDPFGTGYIRISTAMNSNPATYALEQAFDANETGYEETPYINNGGVTLPDGKYKATLYGKDTGNPALPDLTTEKAKSKVFIVRCSGYAYASVRILPATCEVAEQLVYDNTDLYKAVKQSGHASGTYGPRTYSVTFKSENGFTFNPSEPGLNGGRNMQTFSGTLADKLPVTDLRCAPPVVVKATPCIDKYNILVTNENEQGFDYSATDPVDGEYEYVDGALRLATLNDDDWAMTNKVSGARAVNIPVKEYGGDFNVVFNATDGWILPGVHISVDADNDGTIDVVLVAEPDVAGYHTFWTDTPGYLPANAGGQGGPYSGDQDDLLALWPNAVVKAEAFSLGAGVGTDGFLISWSTPCNTYTYDYVAPPVVLEAKASVEVSDGNCEEPGKLTYDTSKWTLADIFGIPTPSDTTGLADYTVIAKAEQNAEFKQANGGTISESGKKLTFQGTLDAQVIKDCVLGENPEEPPVEIPGTPVVEEGPAVLPATSSSQSLTSFFLAISVFVGLVALGAHLIRSNLSRSL